MANKVTSKRAATAASKVLRDGRTSAASKLKFFSHFLHKL